jgi:pimeloyl-ACP methyl ester carboxylesterase
MKIVLVHGRSQQGKNPTAIKKEWRDALVYGLNQAERIISDQTAYVLPFYGDRLAELVDQIEQKMPVELVPRGGADPDPALGTAQREILADIVAGAGVSESDVQREIDVLQPRDPQNWGWVLASLRALGRVPGIDLEVIKSFTKDVAVYITYRGVQDEIDEIVAKDIGNDECVMVAHSLGTVVGYNVLRKIDAQCRALITVGSPLGIKGVSRRLQTPLTSPVGKGRWFNAFDPRDAVALYPLDEAHFNINPRVENYPGVKNFTDNRHGIRGYLADPVVAQRIADEVSD